MSLWYLPDMGRRQVKAVVDVAAAENGIIPGFAFARAPEIRRRLLEAYDAGKRDLPWRGESDPYRVWVSEVMLQQTRVETVIPFYKEWVKRFPSVKALATAAEEEVLRAWQGLGYYSRALNLHRAARMVRESLGGELPATAEGLRALPGVGEYTAGAVASIAFGEAVPAVDGNVRRVLARLFDLPAPGPKELRRLALALLDRDRPGEFNQALMELGSQVCTPRSPGCERCPIGSLCLARERGSVGQRPGKKVRKPPRAVEVAVLVAVAEGPGPPRFLLRKRPSTGLLAALWEFPSVEVPAGEDPRGMALACALESGIGREDLSREPVAGGEKPEREGTGARGPRSEVPGQTLDTVVHAFTHMKVRYHPFLVRLRVEIAPPPAGRWVPLPKLEELPIPVAQRKILKLAAAAGQGGYRPS